MTNWLVLVFAFHWLRLWHKFSGPSTQRGKAKPKQSNITFDTQLENVLTKLVGYPDFVPKLKPSARKSGSMNITISPPHWKMSLKKINYHRVQAWANTTPRSTNCLPRLFTAKKKSYETVHDFFPDGGHELDSQLGPHPFAPFPPSISPPSTLGILPNAGQHDGVINGSASLPHPRSFWFLK